MCLCLDCLVVWLCFVVCCVKVWWIYIFSRGNSCVSRYRNQEYHRRKVYDETLYCCSCCVQRYSNSSPHGGVCSICPKTKANPNVICFFYGKHTIPIPCIVSLLQRVVSDIFLCTHIYKRALARGHVNMSKKLSIASHLSQSKQASKTRAQKLIFHQFSKQ